jgi:hypothetical protein
MGIKDLTGKKFGHLTAIRPTEAREPTNQTVIWECKCDCGEIHYANSNNLQTGRVASCGCTKGRKSWIKSTSKY